MVFFQNISNSKTVKALIKLVRKLFVQAYLKYLNLGESLMHSSYDIRGFMMNGRRLQSVIVLSKPNDSYADLTEQPTAQRRQ